MVQCSNLVFVSLLFFYPFIEEPLCQCLARNACFILEKKLIDKLGGFDERFFMYLEDTDLCKRVWKSKLKIIYNPEINVIHDHGRGGGEEAFENKVIFKKKITKKKNNIFINFC